MKYSQNFKERCFIYLEKLAKFNPKWHLLFIFFLNNIAMVRIKQSIARKCLKLKREMVIFVLIMGILFGRIDNSMVLSDILSRNWGGALGAIAPLTRKSLPFLKEHTNENILFAMKVSFFILFTKITHNESMKDNDCSIVETFLVN